MSWELSHASASSASHSTTHSVPSSALVVYEFLITISNEIDIVWKRPVTVSAVLFGSIRWCMLLTATFELAPIIPNNCAPLYILIRVFLLIGYTQTALFSALRVFAISNRSHIWSLVVFALSMVPFMTNLVDAAMTKYTAVTDPIFGTTCDTNFPFSPQADNILTYITRSSLVLADTIVLVLTWIKTFGNWRRARSVNVQVSLTTCLLRDGQHHLFHSFVSGQHSPDANLQFC
ncbi:uncharacterized protein PHACADRAFT_251462, partial [Phanerochaete carnosa HHB-10118-sp]